MSISQSDIDGLESRFQDDPFSLINIKLLIESNGDECLALIRMLSLVDLPQGLPTGFMMEAFFELTPDQIETLSSRQVQPEKLVSQIRQWLDVRISQASQSTSEG